MRMGMKHTFYCISLVAEHAPTEECEATDTTNPIPFWISVSLGDTPIVLADFSDTTGTDRGGFN